MSRKENINNIKTLKGSDLKKDILSSLKQEILEKNMKIGFAIISIGEDEASKIYITQKAKMAEEIGIECRIIPFKEDVNEIILIGEINKLNKDKSINGIIVQLPISNHLNKSKIINTIIPEKDIDGLTNANLGKLMNNEKGLFPATALGIMKLLDYYNIPLLGQDVLIINKSTLVGKPLALMMLNNSATVTIAHSKTKNLNTILKNFDIIVSAVGKKDLIKKEYVNAKTILIDVGVDRINGKTHGDIEENLKEINVCTPSIGGVGPLTIAMLASNIVLAYKIQNE